MLNPCNFLLKWHEAETRATLMCRLAQHAKMSQSETLAIAGLASSDIETWESAHAKLALHYAEGEG